MEDFRYQLPFNLAGGQAGSHLQWDDGGAHLFEVPSKKPRSDQPLEGDNSSQNVLMELLVKFEFLGFPQENFAAAHLVLCRVQLHNLQEGLDVALRAQQSVRQQDSVPLDEFFEGQPHGVP